MGMQALKKEYIFDDRKTTAYPRPSNMRRIRTNKNEWAARMRRIREACSHMSEEELKAYECIALSSWESR